MLGGFHVTGQLVLCAACFSDPSSAQLRLPGSMLDVTRRCGPCCGTCLLPRVHTSLLGNPRGALPEQGAPPKATQPSQPHPKTPGISETSALQARETAPGVRATPFVSRSKANTKPDKLLSRPCQKGFSHTARHLTFVLHGTEAGRRALLSVRDWWQGEQDWIDNPRAQIPPLIQSHGALIPKVQSELS